MEIIENNNVYTWLDSFVKEYEYKDKKILTIEEEGNLNEIIRNGSEEQIKKARKVLVEHNLPLVKSVAGRFLNKIMDFEDMVSYGTIGLIIAANKYDPNRGCKFSTYAVAWIEQTITRSIRNNGKLIRIPVWYYDEIYKYNKGVNELRNKLKREPTFEEIVANSELSREEILEVIRIQEEPISINMKVGEDEDTKLEDFIADKSVSDYETQKEKEELAQALAILFEKCSLDEREIYVLKQRFGLIDGFKYDLAHIGKELHVAGERVRQIEAKALRILSNSDYVNEISKIVQKEGDLVGNFEIYMAGAVNDKPIRRKYQKQ